MYQENPISMDKLFTKVEQFQAPSTILFRSIELKLLKRNISGLVKPQMKVLDLGCGEGLTANIVFNRKLDIGLDNHMHYVKLARKSGVYKKVIVGDARNIPLPDKSVDIVFSNCVIEHIKNVDLVFREVFRVLKQEGKFIFTTPSHNLYKYSVLSSIKLNPLAKLYGKLRNHKYSHFNCNSAEQWGHILNKYKLSISDSYYYISKREAEFWDFLLYFRYYPLVKSIIYNTYKRAEITDHTGAAVCVIASKK